MTVRFGGHLDNFMSVAQHSVRVSDLMKTPKQRMRGLLHDASETYAGDCVAPLKRMLRGYRRLEPKLLRAIYKGLELPGLLPMTKAEALELKCADQSVLLAERNELKTNARCRYYRAHNKIPKGVVAAPFARPLTWKESEVLFMYRYYHLLEEMRGIREA